MNQEEDTKCPAQQSHWPLAQTNDGSGGTDHRASTSTSTSSHIHSPAVCGNSIDAQSLASAAATALSAASLDDAPQQRRTPLVLERVNFLMFIKILFKILEDAKEPETRSKAQRIVLECRRRSKQGDPHFLPLVEACEERLRVFVGEAMWRRAHLFLHHAITRGQRPPRVATVRPRHTALLAGK
jgi:hypothetical protein